MNRNREEHVRLQSTLDMLRMERMMYQMKAIINPVFEANVRANNSKFMDVLDNPRAYAQGRKSVNF